MTYSDSSDDRPQRRWLHVPSGIWVMLALLAGAAPWVAAALLEFGL